MAFNPLFHPLRRRKWLSHPSRPISAVVRRLGKSHHLLLQKVGAVDFSTLSTRSGMIWRSAYEFLGFSFWIQVSCGTCTVSSPTRLVGRQEGPQSPCNLQTPAPQPQRRPASSTSASASPLPSTPVWAPAAPPAMPVTWAQITLSPERFNTFPLSQWPHFGQPLNNNKDRRMQYSHSLHLYSCFVKNMKPNGKWAVLT